MILQCPLSRWCELYLNLLPIYPNSHYSQILSGVGPEVDPETFPKGIEWF